MLFSDFRGMATAAKSLFEVRISGVDLQMAEPIFCRFGLDVPAVMRMIEEVNRTKSVPFEIRMDKKASFAGAPQKSQGKLGGVRRSSVRTRVSYIELTSELQAKVDKLGVAVDTAMARRKKQAV